MTQTTWKCPDGLTHEATITAEGTCGKTITTVCGVTRSNIPPWQLSPTAAVTCTACRSELILAALSKQTTA